ncbi:hypothetical protein ACRAWG_26965 [Methylobacterium sp. P31]
MTRDQSGGANLSPEARAAAERAGRKRLGENSYPQPAPTPEEQDAANRTKMTVTEKPEPNPHAIKGAMDDE